MPTDTEIEAVTRRNNAYQEQDLFSKVLPKKEQLYNFIKHRVWATTSTIIDWGLSNYYTRSERTMRELAQEPERCIRRMDKDKVKLRFGNTKEEVWEYYGKRESI